MEFIITIGVGYGEVLTGGVVALHKLAYKIANKGYKVTIFTEPVFKHKNIKVEELSKINKLNFDFDEKETIIIPTMEWTNSEKYPNVCRWVLYHLNDELIKNIDKTDKVYNFGNFDLCGLKETGKLTVIDYHEHLFKNENKVRNGKTCYILNKDTPHNYESILKLLRAKDIGNWKRMGAFNYLKDVFNEYEYFVTFDNKSFYTLAAAMCGCKSIILNKKMDPKLFRENNPIQKYGVAYGIEDIEWSEKTIENVSNYVNILIDNDNKTVDGFINDCIDMIR